jgi:hypothetical protein
LQTGKSQSTKLIYQNFRDDAFIKGRHPFVIIKGKLVKKSAFLLLFILSFFLSTGKEIPLKDACLAARNFYYEHVNQYHPVGLNEISIHNVFTATFRDKALYYIVNLEKNGFVIVSADDAVVPILGYSFEGNYSADNAPPQFVEWMQQYHAQTRYITEKNVPPSEKTKAAWAHLLTTDPTVLVPLKNQRSVEPLIQSKWNQNTFYNEMCPAAPGGPGGHAYAGCVPTALGQILYYYRWPDHGTGSYTDNDPQFGMLHANFDSTWYAWNNMTNFISASNHGIAELLYHLGISCDLVYGAGGSGMYNHKAAYALKTFFKYSPGTQYVWRDSTNLDWDSLIIAHLDRKMPMYYAGWKIPNSDGHAFVCDGYQDSLYVHFNWGWGGTDDGYFYLDNISPPGYDFHLAHELIINIFPDTLHYTYPSYCTGGTSMNYREGSFEDGSGPVNNYHAGSNCSWLIDPQTDEDSVSRIILSFSKFQLGLDDHLKIYEGPTTNSPLLRSYSGNSVPDSDTLDGNKMLVTFTSGNGTVSPGWLVTYKTSSPVWCNSTTTITEDTAEISDGSLSFNYHDRSNCKWKIKPLNQEGKPLTLYFTSFDTEKDKDILEIHDLADSIPTHFLAKISGSYQEPNLPDSVTSPSGTMFIIFTSNSSVNGKGWEAYYPKRKLSGINDGSGIPGLSIFPNPASEYILIRLINQKSQQVDAELLTIEGKIVLHEKLSFSAGIHERQLEISVIPAGMYLLRLTGGNGVITKKVVIN